MCILCKLVLRNIIRRIKTLCVYGVLKLDDEEKVKNRNDNYFFVFLNTRVTILLIGNMVELEEKWTMKRKLKNRNDNYFFVVFNTHVTILLISNM